jgi:triphosphoribosyl-dephospho-CoA synthase
VEQPDALAGKAQLRTALEAVLAALNLDDTRCAYRAIALANPAGLGRADAEDVHAQPHLPLREAMALAAQRDSIARQYASGYADLFDPTLPTPPPGFPPVANAPGAEPDGATVTHVQQVYLHFMSRWPDSHIVRKHGGAVAHTVMSAAQAWQGHLRPDADPAFAAWDEALKAQRINPGTSADLSVAARSGQVWHGK